MASKTMGKRQHLKYQLDLMLKLVLAVCIMLSDEAKLRFRLTFAAKSKHLCLW